MQRRTLAKRVRTLSRIPTGLKTSTQSSGRLLSKMRFVRMVRSKDLVNRQSASRWYLPLSFPSNFQPKPSIRKNGMNTIVGIVLLGPLPRLNLCRHRELQGSFQCVANGIPEGASIQVEFSAIIEDAQQLGGRFVILECVRDPSRSLVLGALHDIFCEPTKTLVPYRRSNENSFSYLEECFSHSDCN